MRQILGGMVFALLSLGGFLALGWGLERNEAVTVALLVVVAIVAGMVTTKSGGF